LEHVTLALGYLCIGDAVLGFVLWTDRGRLFHPRNI
jgi:hypothetical protein